jgi:hypothetical protein
LAPLLLAVWVLAAPPAPTTKPALRCTLTGKRIESCCCVQREGKLYCPLAKKAIESCCCVPVEQKPR